jgi:hypothetical protein
LLVDPSQNPASTLNHRLRGISGTDVVGNWGVAESMRLRAGELNYLRPLLGFFCDALSVLGR